MIRICGYTFTGLGKGTFLGLLACLLAEGHAAPMEPVPTGDPPLVVKVHALARAPVVDGDIREWADLAPVPWLDVDVQPTLRNDVNNETGHQGVQLLAGVHQGRFYLAMRWPDTSEDVEYKVWKWNQSRNQYQRGKERDDMIALRFHMSGNYDTCMLSDKTYQVDLWQWSAGRSNLAAMAEDLTHLISQKPLENAAEYGEPPNMVYIQKRRDAGTPFFENSDPGPTFQGDKVGGVKVVGSGEGSLADVRAKGVWREGYWTLEVTRVLDTGHTDDQVFKAGEKIPGAIAVFNKGYSEHKSVNGNLLFDFTNLSQ